MDSRTVNDDGAPSLLFVLGYGNRLDDATVGWMTDRLVEAGYRVHVIQLPTEVTDFEREYRRPVQRAHDEHEPTAVIGHSLGGLVAAFLDTTATPLYLSPWWGINEAKVSTWERMIVPRLPIRVPILPTNIRREDLGVYLSDVEWAQLPTRISPVCITEIYRAQQRRPSIGADAIVFVSLADTVVSLNAIGTAVRSDQLRVYDGNHQLFAARCRDAAVEQVLTALPP